LDKLEIRLRTVQHGLRSATILQTKMNRSIADTDDMEKSKSFDTIPILRSLSLSVLGQKPQIKSD